MTKIAMHILCTLHAQTMRMACALFVMAGAAQAGAWDEFEARCLVPIENVTLEQPADIKARKNFKNDGDTYSQYVLSGAHLSISDGRGARAKWCSAKVTFGEVAAFVEQAKQWQETAIGTGRYELIEDFVLGGFHLRSTEWREPKLDAKLFMQLKGSDSYFRVEETDLES